MTLTHPTKSTNLFPALSLLLSATLWGLIWYPLRLLEAGGLHGAWQAVVLYLAAALVLLPSWSGLWRAWRGAPFSISVLALASGWCNLAFMLAVLDGNIVRVILLFYLSPLWAVLLGWLLLGERLEREGTFVLILALIGAIIMLWDPAAGYPWPINAADWMALSAGITFAISNVEIRRLQNVTVRVKTVSAWLGCVLISVAAIAVLKLPLPEAATGTWLGALLLGVMAITVMTLAVQYGVTHLPIQRSAVILLFEIVVGAVSSQWLTDEIILPREWLGGAMIIAAAWISAYRGLEH